jgi:catechol 2,3-dioxygenase-like lactoylglutathione lyase family enzyme
MAKLRHIAITVPDPERAAKFYMEAFGLKRVGETDWAGASGVYLSDGVVNIALLRYKTEEMAGHRGRGFVGVHHVGFVVEDVAAARKKVEDAGAKHWMGEPREGGGFYEVKYHDPDGIVFDLTENGWVGAEKKYKGTDPSYSFRILPCRPRRRPDRAPRPPRGCAASPRRTCAES